VGLNLGRCVLGALLCVSIAGSALWALDPGRGLLDFGSFVMAGEAKRQGLDPYAVHHDLADASGLDFGHADGRGYSPNLNPPVSLYAFQPLSRLDAVTSMAVLNLASTAIYGGLVVWLVRMFAPSRRVLAALWLTALPAFWFALWLGQVYVLLAALGLVAWYLLKHQRHLLLAGVLIGVLVAVKPNFLLLPVILLLAGHRLPSVAALATAAAISAVPLILEGPTIYEQWLQAAAAYPRVGLPTNASVFAPALRLGLEPVGYTLAAAVAGISAVAAWRSRPNAEQAWALGTLAALLVGPLSWVGYAPLVLPLLATRRWCRWEIASAAALSAPVWLVVAPAGGGPIGQMLALLYFSGISIIFGLVLGDVLASRRAQLDQSALTLAAEPERLLEPAA
jgi:hypothetical protein